MTIGRAEARLLRAVTLLTLSCSIAAGCSAEGEPSSDRPGSDASLAQGGSGGHSGGDSSSFGAGGSFAGAGGEQATGGAPSSGGAAGTGGASGTGSLGTGGSSSDGGPASDGSSGGDGSAGGPSTHVTPHPGAVATYRAETPYQRGVQQIQVLLPGDYTPAKTYRVLYVLPVEARQPVLFGDGLTVLQAIRAHDAYQLIIVQMTFQDEPWFGDHATDPLIRQASYLKEYVVPFVERSYSVAAGPKSRLLIGFSKSGWGAFSLILSEPDFFGYAASWDAPLMFDKFNYGMQSVFGTQAQLDRLRPDLLAARNAVAFKGAPRLVLAGEALWGSLIPPPAGTSHTVQYHQLLDNLGVSHTYDDGTPAPHNWNATWVQRTLDHLMAIVR